MRQTLSKASVFQLCMQLANFAMSLIIIGEPVERKPLNPERAMHTSTAENKCNLKCNINCSAF